MSPTYGKSHGRQHRSWRALLLAGLLCATFIPSAFAADQVYFPAVDNVTNVLVQKINAETVRIDLSCWYLTEHAISIALINKYRSGVPVRLLGDRGSIFEIDPRTNHRPLAEHENDEFGCGQPLFDFLKPEIAPIDPRLVGRQEHPVFELEFCLQ